MVSQKILDRQVPNLPEEIKFCKRCVISNQRPRIQFDDEGVCGACRFTDIKNEIDWESREKELKELCDQHRRTDGRFDVIVPASGGKDSARVAYELKYNYGMHPLTITWAPFEYTPVGYTNFRGFINEGGFTNLMAWPNGNFHKKIARVSFEAVGDAFHAFVCGQMSYAFHIAKAFDVKLVFFGENGEAEYGGNPKVFNLKGMPVKEWSEQHFKGVTIDDLVQYGLNETDYFTEKDYDETDKLFYEPPKDLEKNSEFHWFSYYKKWVPQENYYLAAEHMGFQANPEGRSEGTYSKYASLDDQLDGLHFYMAFLKFGIGRATQDAAHEVRDGHITRDEAVALVKKYDGEFPKQGFRDFLNYLEMPEEEFWPIADKYRSPHVWNQEDGIWKLRKAVYDDASNGDYKLDYEPAYLTSFPKYANPKK